MSDKKDPPSRKYKGAVPKKGKIRYANSTMNQGTYTIHARIEEDSIPAQQGNLQYPFTIPPFRGPKWQTNSPYVYYRYNSKGTLVNGIRPGGLYGGGGVVYPVQGYDTTGMAIPRTKSGSHKRVGFKDAANNIKALHEEYKPGGPVSQEAAARFELGKQIQEERKAKKKK
jgi:hypothetical protein